MRTLLQAVEEVVVPDLLLSGPIELKESHPGSRCQPITLHRSGRVVVLQLDRPGVGSDRLFPLFRADEGLHAICDYVVLCQETKEADIFVLSCELKTGDPRKAKVQIENTTLVVRHLLDMAMHHRPVERLPNIAYRGIVFTPRAPAVKEVVRRRCPYENLRSRIDGLGIAYYRDNARYPLEHFCV